MLREITSWVYLYKRYRFALPYQLQVKLTSTSSGLSGSIKPGVEAKRISSTDHPACCVWGTWPTFCAKTLFGTSGETTIIWLEINQISQ